MTYKSKKLIEDVRAGVKDQMRTSLPSNFSRFDLSEEENDFYFSSEETDLNFRNDYDAIPVDSDRLDQSERISELENVVRNQEDTISEKDERLKSYENTLAHYKESLESTNKIIEQQQSTIQKLETELKEKGIEFLDLQNRMKRKEERDMIRSEKKSNVDEFEILKEKYFFQKALNVKLMNPTLLNLDINEMYITLNKQNIDFDEWDEWIFQNSSNPDFHF